MMTFGEFATFLDNSARTCRPRLEGGLAALGAHMRPVARDYIGHELQGWAPLSQATLKGFRHPYGFWIKGKEELGYTGHVSATDPLLRTGKMRDSIEVEVAGLSMALGSPSKVALFQEMGTHNPLTGDIPPRPFLARAMQAGLPQARAVFGGIAASLLNPTLALRGGTRP